MGNVWGCVKNPTSATAHRTIRLALKGDPDTAGVGCILQPCLPCWRGVWCVPGRTAVVSQGQSCGSSSPYLGIPRRRSQEGSPNSCSLFWIPAQESRYGMKIHPSLLSIKHQNSATGPAIELPLVNWYLHMGTNCRISPLMFIFKTSE